MTDWPQIVADHGPAVWRTVYRVLGDHADAADCYQDTFLAAQTATGVRDWPAFLVALATRRAVDRLRRRRRAGPLVAEPAALADPAAGLELAELLEAVRDRLADLPPRQAEAFWLTAVEELSHDRVAAHLGTSTGSVRVLVHRGRTALAAALSPDWSER